MSAPFVMLCGLFFPDADGRGVGYKKRRTLEGKWGWRPRLQGNRIKSSIMRRVGNVQFHRIAIAAFVLALTATVFAQDLTQEQKNAVGKWQVIKEKGPTGAEVVTYIENGKLYGKITKRDTGTDPNGLCTKCSGDLKNQKILGMVFIFGFSPDGEGWSGGFLVDPDEGKVYKGKLHAIGADQLYLRGYIGFSLLGRTQTWKRIP
jgi:uncharacterized protein (DUF2147 family)